MSAKLLNHEGERKTMIEQTLARNDDLKKYLFIRGFLITEEDLKTKQNTFPFYDHWYVEQIGPFQFWIHELQKLFWLKIGDTTFFLIGHAYNPFTMDHEEEKILRKVADSFSKGIKEFYDAVDEITGLFVMGYIKDESINFLIDPNGLQSGYYGNINNKFYLSSHAQLIGDICNLEVDPFVTELVQYKWYNRVMGPYLPSDLSKYSNVKRIVPNIHFAYKNGDFSINRFYPREGIEICKNEEDYKKIIVQAADILKNNMTLIARKWNRPQISLTGGIDSNTTFAAANGIYDKFETFSYVSAKKESLDAEAAQKISSEFDLKHTLYAIPDTAESLLYYNDIVDIIKHNNGYIRKEKDSELRKRVILMHECPADVEVKSWGSETIRAYWYKHFGRKTMPRLSGKLYRNLYKIFIANRQLAHKVDKLFNEYIEKFSYESIPEAYPTADMHFWEVTWGSWGGMNISEMKICFDITIPYNNRKFLDLLFRVPLEKRISDQHHLDMKKYLNKELFDMNIRVVNLHETKFRSSMLNLIFSFNTMLPF